MRRKNRVRRLESILRFFGGTQVPPQRIPLRRPTREERALYKDLRAEMGLRREKLISVKKRIGNQDVKIVFSWKDSKSTKKKFAFPDAVQSFIRSVERLINRGKRVRIIEIKLSKGSTKHVTDTTVFLDELFASKGPLPFKALFLDPRVAPHLSKIQGLLKTKR